MIYINFGGTILSNNFDIKILDDLIDKDNVINSSISILGDAK